MKILTLMDEFSRQCLAMVVERRITSEGVLDALSALFALRGVPEYIRSDNGSEFTAKAVRGWLNDFGVTKLSIEPGSPWENGFIERFNGSLRDELLNREIFYALGDAQVVIEDWRYEYNRARGRRLTIDLFLTSAITSEKKSMVNLRPLSPVPPAKRWAALSRCATQREGARGSRCRAVRRTGRSGW